MPPNIQDLDNGFLDVTPTGVFAIMCVSLERSVRLANTPWIIWKGTQYHLRFCVCHQRFAIPSLNTPLLDI
jgi:hypothetical protein